MRKSCRVIEVDAFTVDDLPGSRRGLIEKDGSIGAMGLLYGSYDRRNAREVITFQDSFGELRVDGEVVPISSNGFIIADVVRFVKSDAADLGLYVALALLIILIIDLRSARGVVACMARSRSPSSTPSARWSSSTTRSGSTT